MSIFKDYFSSHADEYSRYRPLYPSELFEYLANLTVQQVAWDCATGNGQVAIGLTPFFDHIYATDASPQQLDRAFSHPKITYQVALAEQTQIPDQSVDLVTVGQAIHWFNFDRFYQEVRRVGKAGSTIAVWCYGVLELQQSSKVRDLDRVNQLLQAFYREIDPIWAPEVKWVKEDYRTIPFPFEEVAAPSFSMTQNWTVDQVLQYFRTWSATQHYIAEHGEQSFMGFEQNLKKAWGEAIASIEWQLPLRVGRLGEG
jgi:ubiquinone/menaquinone biosynthesis C-methylase UbiE